VIKKRNINLFIKLTFSINNNTVNGKDKNLPERMHACADGLQIESTKGEGSGIQSNLREHFYALGR
jgi:hypothetical protein